MITYIEDESDKYPPRTFANAKRADMTIAFAIDFTTAGEKLTKSAAQKLGRSYMAVDVTSRNPDAVRQALSACEIIKIYSIKSINIAGNSLKTLHKHGLSQRNADIYISAFLFVLIEEGVKLRFICSGGQSGFDEAGLKAAVKFGIPAICHCPKGWPYLIANGQTIRDELLFKKRFEL